ncbi:MAG: hypothetical protein ACRCZI_05410 [Cetobacterium sp.]
MLKELAKLSMITSEIRLLDDEMQTQTLDFLLRVAAHPEGVSQVDIAARVGLSSSALSRNCEILGEGITKKGKPGLGLINTEEGWPDRRRKTMKLTAKGQRFVEQLIRILNAGGGVET